MTHPEKQGKARVQSTLRTPPLCTAPMSQAHSHAQSNVMVRALAGRASKSPHNPTIPEAVDIEEGGCSAQSAQVGPTSDPASATLAV